MSDWACRCQTLEASSSSDSATAAAQLEEQMQQAAQAAEEAKTKLDNSQSLLAQREDALADSSQKLTQLQVLPRGSCTLPMVVLWSQLAEAGLTGVQQLSMLPDAFFGSIWMVTGYCMLIYEHGLAVWKLQSEVLWLAAGQVALQIVLGMRYSVLSSGLTANNEFCKAHSSMQHRP